MLYYAYAEANLSAQEKTSDQNTWIYGPEKYIRRAKSVEAPPRQRKIKAYNIIFMLPPNNRLNLRYTRTILGASVNSIAHPLFLVRVWRQQNPTSPSRFACRVAKKLDKRSTRRNRTRRLVLQAIHTLLPEIKSGYDCMFIAKTILWDKKEQEVLPIVRESLEKLRLLRSPR